MCIRDRRYRQRYVDLIVNPEVKRNFVIRSPTDLRRGIDGLANLVKSQFQMDPFQRARCV